LSRIEEFVREHARMTIMVTRFLGTPGVVVNFLCGLSKLPYRSFVLYDAIGNALIRHCSSSPDMLWAYTPNNSPISGAHWLDHIRAILIFLAVKLFLRRTSMFRICPLRTCSEGSASPVT